MPPSSPELSFDAIKVNSSRTDHTAIIFRHTRSACYYVPCNILATRFCISRLIKSLLLSRCIAGIQRFWHIRTSSFFLDLWRKNNAWLDFTSLAVPRPENSNDSSLVMRINAKVCMWLHNAMLKLKCHSIGSTIRVPIGNASTPGETYCVAIYCHFIRLTVN